MQLVVHGEIKEVQNRELHNKVLKETDNYVEVFIQQDTQAEDKKLETVILSSDFTNELKGSIGKLIVIPFIHRTYWDDNRKNEISILQMDQEKHFSIYSNNLLARILYIIYANYATVFTKGERYEK